MYVGLTNHLTLCMVVAQPCPTLCDPKDCSLPGSSVHGILRARILGWVAIPFSRGSSQPRDQTWVSCIADRCFIIWATREAHLTLLPGNCSGSVGTPDPGWANQNLPWDCCPFTEKLGQREWEWCWWGPLFLPYMVCLQKVVSTTSRNERWTEWEVWCPNLLLQFFWVTLIAFLAPWALKHLFCLK